MCGLLETLALPLFLLTHYTTLQVRSFYSENKRCDNTRMKNELMVRLRYPTYREGLSALYAEERALLSWRQQLLEFLQPLLAPTLACYGTCTLLLRQLWLRRSVACLAVDNGSLRPEPTFFLREIASLLSTASSPKGVRCGLEVRG